MFLLAFVTSLAFWTIIRGWPHKQNDSGLPVEVLKRPLRFSNLNFLHTTDTHGWLSGHLNQPTYKADWGDFVAFAEHMKKKAEENGQDLLLVDSGDRHDGNGLSDSSVPNGVRSTPIFARQNYDIVTLGNHELYTWEASEQEVKELVPHFGENYVCSNVEYLKNGLYVPFGNKFRYFTTPRQGLRILSFAFLFDFNRANEKTRVTPIQQAVHAEWFASVLADHPPSEVDVIAIVGHIPVTRQWTELQFLHSVLRDAYPETIIQYFGGHSHIRDFLVFDGLLTGLQSGRFCETVGFLSVDTSKNAMNLKQRFFRSYIDFNMDLFMFHTGVNETSFASKSGNVVKKMLADARADLDLDKVIGKVTKSNYYMDYVPLTHPKNIFHLLTSKVLPTLKPKFDNATTLDQRIVIINTGSVRYDLYKGPYTIDTHYIVSPFENEWVKVSLPKRIALQIAPLLNRKEYIAQSDIDLSYLRPPHHRSAQEKQNQNLQISIIYPDLTGEAEGSGGLTKGYVTYDAFGNDGDDTPHKGVVNFPIPNVVQSERLIPSSRNDVDVVFYSFLIPNIEWAVKELGHEMPQLEFYSDNYLGELLNQYVATNTI